MRETPDRIAVLGLVIVMGEPLLSRVASAALVGHGVALRVGVGLGMAWLATGAVLTLVLFREKRPPAAVGLRPPRGSDLIFGLAGFCVSAVAVTLTFPLVEALGLDSLESGVRRLASLPLALRLVIPLSAGITEEILFRGYLIECMGRLTGRPGLSVLASWSIFTALHLPFWGVGGTLQIGVVAAVLCTIYALTRSVLPCMVMHVLNDAWAFVVVPLLIPEFV